MLNSDHTQTGVLAQREVYCKEKLTVKQVIGSCQTMRIINFSATVIQNNLGLVGGKAIW